MKCPKCGQDLTIASTNFESKEETTKVECVQKLVCRNTKCGNYCGRSTKNPKVVVDTIRKTV